MSELVDTGATSHIVNGNSNFVELADGTRSNNIALKQGSVQIKLCNKSGVTVMRHLKTLYIYLHTHRRFSVYAANKQGATVNFGPHSAELMTKEGTKFNIEKKGKLYFLNKCNLVQSNTRTCNLTMWHLIMGHCTKDLVQSSKRCRWYENRRRKY